MNFCPKCGNKLNGTESYCTNCGININKDNIVNNKNQNNKLSDVDIIKKSKKLSIVSLILAIISYIVVFIIVIFFYRVDNIGSLILSILYGGILAYIIIPVSSISSIILAIKSLRYKKNILAKVSLCITILLIILFILLNLFMMLYEQLYLY